MDGAGGRGAGPGGVVKCFTTTAGDAPADKQPPPKKPKPAAAAETGPTTTAAERAEAQAMRAGVGGGGDAATADGGNGGVGGGSSALVGLTAVTIDEGTQKYVLIEVSDPASGGGGDGASRLLVRGDAMADYHKDAARPTLQQLDSLGLAYNVLGGGRIKHSASERSIEIYGFSYGFPWADDVYRHDLSAKLCVEAFGESYSVTTSDEGY